MGPPSYGGLAINVSPAANIPEFRPSGVYPAAMTSPAITPSTYPLQLDFEAPEKIARWRPLIHWLLIIPQFVVIYVLAIVQRVVFIISWFAILFTGQMPE